MGSSSSRGGGSDAAHAAMRNQRVKNLAGEVILDGLEASRLG